MTLLKQTTPDALLGNRSFWWYWSSRIFSILGAQIQTVAIGWQIYELTQDPFALGMVGLLQFLPALLFTIPSGYVADHFNRRTIVYISQIIYCFIAFVLVMGNQGHWLSPALIYALAFLFGSVRTFEFPCASAILPGLVPASSLPRAISLSSSARQAALIAGPAVGGIMYALDALAPYLLATSLFVLAGIATFIVKYQPARVQKKQIDMKTMLGGIAFIWSQPVILGVISLDLVAVLLGGATALLPIFASDILEIGPTGLGILRAAPGVGALLMSFYLVRYPIRRQAGKAMLAAVAVFGIAMIVFAFSKSVVLSVFALLVSGAADMISVVIRDTLVQLETPDAMRGRVNAFNWLFIGASNQLGEFESGVTAAWWGAVPATAVGGVGTLLVTLLWMKLFPVLVQRDRLITEEKQ